MRVKNKCFYDNKQAEATIKALKKTIEPFRREIANRDGTISTQDKQLRIQSTMIFSENDKNELGTQSRIFAKKVNDLHSEIEANKKESIESRKKIEDLEATVLKLRHRNENLERSIDNIVIINKSIVKCNNDQPAKSYSMKESLQKQIYKLQDQINNEKSKNSNLLNQIKMVKNLKEIDDKSSAKNLNDEIRRLTNLNKNLTLKNNGLKKYKEDNNILKSKTKDLENRLTYMQHKLTNLDNKKTSHILNTGVLEMVHPEIKKNRVTNNQLVKAIIECRTKLNESNLAKKQV
ncbi:girdin-like [Metopolophium dirhodum]|uniref:girdin-like n=1 Tax=Metopolophium dirhodum TaxID=44670 RepID=UPI0029907B21|nr:girdin-like [Metopolophium dirhodum]